MKKVLFICTHNAARSQIAEAYLNKLYGDIYEAYSAGVEPTKINPRVVEIMAEAGLDISEARSKSVEEYRGKDFDYVVTMCDHARDVCPFFEGEVILHRSFTDPSTIEGSEDEIYEKTREVRDEIKNWIMETFGN